MPKRRLLLFSLAAVFFLVFPNYGFSTAESVARRQSLDGTWQLWFDEKADWQHEKLVLDSSDLSKVPNYPPSIGWDEMLKRGQPYTVPATWDEHFPHHHGAGWYWRELRIPTAARGKLIRLSFAAVRQHAEVYLNRKLVGYSLEGFTPFVVDITAAARYNEPNLLAVRVTNAGGGDSWADFVPIVWGDVHLPDSHDFGGIWQHVDLLITAPTFIENVYAAPLEDLTTVRVVTTVTNTRAAAQNVALSYEAEAADGKKVADGIASGSVPAHSQQSFETAIKIPQAELWSPDTPKQYRLITRLRGRGEHDQVETAFGMRFFSEKNGKLFLNGHRVVVRSSINFGFYPYTVAYPSIEFAEKEIRAAKALGLNTLSCHRTACTPALLDAADRLGLMIYEEPGGAPRERQPEPQSPAEAFERQAFLAKLNRLVVRDRNHPALVWWNMANEAFSDVVNDPAHLKPYIDQLMRTTHRLDPSRFVTYTSARQTTVMLRPFEDEYGFLYDAHTVENVPAVWRDVLTIEHSRFQAPATNEVAYNGESRNLDSLGDLPMLAAKFSSSPAGSYEAEWRHWAEMLERDFARYQLGKYFNNTSELCRLIGLQQGEGFSREVEAVRLSDAASGLALNGWQSHAGVWLTFSDGSKMPAHWTSGLVDTLRNPNFPPEMLAHVNEPVHLAVVPIPSVTYAGSKVQVTVSLINEQQLKGAGELVVKMSGPGSTGEKTIEKQVEIEGDSLTFVQPLVEVTLSPQGMSPQSESYLIEAELHLTGGKTLKGQRPILVENQSAWTLPSGGIEVQDSTHMLDKYLEAKSDLL